MKSNVSLPRRLGAIAYDIFLAFSLAFFITGVVLIVFFDRQAQNNILIFALTLISVYFYFTWSWIHGRQTLGMKAWKFQIIQNNGENITQKQALVRFVLAIFSFSLFGLGFLYQLFNKNNHSFHDQYSNTQLMKNQWKN